MCSQMVMQTGYSGEWALEIVTLTLTCEVLLPYPDLSPNSH